MTPIVTTTATISFDTSAEVDEIERAVAKALGATYWRDIEFRGPGDCIITSETDPLHQVHLAASAFRGESLEPFEFENPDLAGAVSYVGVLEAEYVETRRALRAA